MLLEQTNCVFELNHPIINFLKVWLHNWMDSRFALNTSWSHLTSKYSTKSLSSSDVYHGHHCKWLIMPRHTTQPYAWWDMAEWGCGKNIVYWAVFLSLKVNLWNCVPEHNSWSSRKGCRSFALLPHETFPLSAEWETWMATLAAIESLLNTE